MFNRLNLPKPSTELLAVVRELAENRPFDLSVLDWHERQQPKGTNCAYGDFFTDKSLNSYVEAEYQSFFNVEVVPIIGIIKNTKTIPASYAPHSDKFRHITANFYIELGGSRVETIFYDKVDPIDDLVGGHIISYDDLPPITDRLMFESNEWYILPTRQYHSVENIENNRLILSLSYIGIIEEFINSHKHLIID